ncbi:helix-turn-helix domain-containing protein (plasmid) [Streptomyces sp. NBC_01213]|uniref:helix-turn-helix domain-containing protein n=1 Tax=Streptomyces sp. NBC_01213 TaxID=2903776 RepID=UPI002F912097|nr:helix-turn-helix domain-containing protein [Streptomyces sp. NBC_01213]
MTEDDIAAATGLPLHTWRRRHGADFRARVPVVNEGERLRIYDTAQATAYTNGQALPQTPTTNPDPEDLLSDKEAARILGVDARTVRAYAATGYLPAGTERHGRTWWPRHTIETRRDTPDQRHHNPGRQPGTARTTTPRHDPRIAEIAALLTRGNGTTTTDIAHRYNVGERTAQRLIAQARQHTD